MTELATIIATITGALGVFLVWLGRDRRKQRQTGAQDVADNINEQRAQANEDTNQRIDHRPPVDPSDHDDILERLSKLGRKSQR